MKDTIPVFVVSDNKYAYLVSTTLISIMENTKSQINFNVIDTGISKENRMKILDDASPYKNLSVNFIDLSLDKFKDLPKEKGYVSKSAYARFLVPTFASNFKKAIYTDIDVIFTKDIKELYNEDLGQYIIGAVPDAMYKLNKTLNNYQRRLQISPQHEYFYSGLLLFNIKAFNKLNVAKSLIDISNRYKSTLLQCDQDILNKAFDNNYKILSPKYVVTSEYLDNINVFNDDYIKNELENMVIRHFAGKNKPWNSKIKIPDSELFWKILSMSSFNEYVLNLEKQRKKIKIFYKVTRLFLKGFPYFLVEKQIRVLKERINEI